MSLLNSLLLMVALAAPAAAAEPQLPTLVTRAPAVYPEGPLSEGRGALVPLKLTIDEEGHVVDASVIEPQGEGFDQAAEVAARQFQFTPARDEAGNPVASVVQFNFVFEASAAPIPASRARSTRPASASRWRASRSPRPVPRVAGPSRSPTPTVALCLWISPPGPGSSRLRAAPSAPRP